MDGRPEQKLGCVGESEAEAQTARGLGAADGAGNTVSGNGEHKKRLFIYSPFSLACVKGFEPSTYWSVASRSIQLSYTHTP